MTTSVIFHCLAKWGIKERQWWSNRGDGMWTRVSSVSVWQLKPNPQPNSFLLKIDASLHHHTAFAFVCSSTQLLWIWLSGQHRHKSSVEFKQTCFGVAPMIYICFKLKHVKYIYNDMYKNSVYFNCLNVTLFVYIAKDLTGPLSWQLCCFEREYPHTPAETHLDRLR